MNSRKKFRQNKNKTRNKRGGGPQEDAELFHAVDTGQSVSLIKLILDKAARFAHIACYFELTI